MLTKRAGLQQALLALTALFALTHFYLGAGNSFENLNQGQSRGRPPFYIGASDHAISLSESQAHEAGLRAGDAVPAITLVQPEAAQAGLHVGDVVISINRLPFTGTAVLLRELRNGRAGQVMVLSLLHSTNLQTLPSTVAIILAPERILKPPLWAKILQITFLFLPCFCLLTGLYVVFMQPRNAHAWLILGILSSFDSFFIPSDQLYGRMTLVALIWSTVALTAMPVCLMLLGIYFPERSRLDTRFPWIKWLLIIPNLLLLPIDLLYDFGHTYDFNAYSFLFPWLAWISSFETVVRALAISYFFPNLFSNLAISGPDARRRLRVLYVGALTGLTPFFILLVVSLIRGLDIGQDVSQWITIPAFLILLLFPLSLAYVVVVQRAMDVRLLIRQGTKYLFARGTLRILTLILLVVMLYFISAFVSTPSHRRPVDAIRIFALAGFFVAFNMLAVKRLQAAIDRRFFRDAYSAEQVLSDLSGEARNFIETRPLLETISQRIRVTLHVQSIAFFLQVGDTFRLEMAGYRAANAGISKDLALSADSRSITTLTGTGLPAFVYRDDPSSWFVDATDAERAVLTELSTELLVPLPGRNRLIGIMALGPKQSQEPYSRSDQQLLRSVASQTGLALENAELLESLTTEVAQRERAANDLEIAREVQERLFPQGHPSLPGVDLAGFCRPAQAVGGDYYDFFELPMSSHGQSSLGIAIGDISGKGIPAALLMASLRASLRSAASLEPNAYHHDLALLVGHVNRMVFESSSSNRYATFFYAQYDPSIRTLTYVNAGHNSPCILRTMNGSSEVIRLEPTGTVIGLLHGATYAQSSLNLQSGDIFLAFTDGISEAMTRDEEEWGEERMLACVQRLISDRDFTTTAHQLVSSILGATDTFTAGAAQHDDMTLLVGRFG